MLLYIILFNSYYFFLFASLVSLCTILIVFHLFSKQATSATAAAAPMYELTSRSFSLSCTHQSEHSSMCSIVFYLLLQITYMSTSSMTRSKNSSVSYSSIIHFSLALSFALSNYCCCCCISSRLMIIK